MLPVRPINCNKITNDKDAASCNVMSLPCQPKKYLWGTCHRRVHAKHQSKTQQDSVARVCVCVYIYIYIRNYRNTEKIYTYKYIQSLLPRRTECVYTNVCTSETRVNLCCDTTMSPLHGCVPRKSHWHGAFTVARNVTATSPEGVYIYIHVI